MQSLRQLGGGVIIAIVSVILVLGGIFLSLAESLPGSATPTQIPPTLPASFPTPTGTITITPSAQTATSTETATGSPSPTASQLVLLPTSCTSPSGWIRIITSTGDTIYSLAQRYKTSADSLSSANCLTTADLPAGVALYVPPVPTVTVIPCGPPAGWVKAHTVQPGDNLYRIAVSYGITYPQLQRGNCMGNSTTIYAGQRLWVPNVPTLTPVPGVTIVPTFPTEITPPTVTELPSATSTSLPTITPLPSSTFTATVTLTQVPPQ
ncbi:MAG TPA: LysM peptidoglycan-binding domain-containing protein [Anaerolineales bacterium]|nr:LysM peptidoglycan-binding domain-containing protein [Anaerolineales bacterium]